MSTYTCNGRSTRLVSGAGGALLEWVARELHRRVEPCVTFYGYRSHSLNVQSGGIETSNHRSATAFDYNGFRHPYERAKRSGWSSGFSQAQHREVRAILAECGGLVKWGQDFPIGWRDPMHFELRGSDAQVSAMWAAIRARTSVPAKPPAPVVPPFVPDNPLELLHMDRIIAAIFRANLGRTPREDEIDAHLNVFAKTGDIRAVYQGIYSSPEAVARRR